MTGKHPHTLLSASAPWYLQFIISNQIGWCFLLCIEPLKLRRVSVSPCKALFLQPLSKGSGMPREGESILTYLSFLISNSVCISIHLHLRDWGQSSLITGLTARAGMGVYLQLIKTKSQFGIFRFFSLFKSAALNQPCFETQAVFRVLKGLSDRE